MITRLDRIGAVSNAREMRTHPCVRLFTISDTLTITSMLPGVDVSMKKSAAIGVGKILAFYSNMSALGRLPETCVAIHCDSHFGLLKDLL